MNLYVLPNSLLPLARDTLPAFMASMGHYPAVAAARSRLASGDCDDNKPGLEYGVKP